MASRSTDIVMMSTTSVNDDIDSEERMLPQGRLA